MPARSPSLRGDRALALLLFIGAVAYLSYLPRNLGYADESYFLYEAKRIRDGEVMYRDIFQFVTPLSSYAMAALFWLFGTTMATARISMAVLHGVTVVLLYWIGRRLGVRKEIAAVVPLAYVALCQAAWPYASWHWFSTFFSTALLLSLVAGPWSERPRWAFIPGVLNGLLIGTQQQKGVVMAAGVCLLLVVDHLMDRRYPTPEPWRRVASRLSFFFAGLAAVVVPLLLAFALMAGGERLYDALVRFPLENYRSHFSIRWGLVGPLAGKYASYTVPALLRYSPLWALLPLSRCLLDFARRRERQRVRKLSALIVLSGFGALSIWYFPDFIHVAFIAPAFWVCAAVGLEWVLSGFGRSARVSRLAGAVVVLVLASGLVLQMTRFARILRQQFPIAHQTAFGRVDFASRRDTILVDEVRELLAHAPSRELFCYPHLAGPYLTTGGSNPTPYQYLASSVSPRSHTEEVLSILETRRVPYVLASLFFMRADDPIVRFIREHYELVRMPEMAGAGGLPSVWLYGWRNRVQPGEEYPALEG